MESGRPKTFAIVASCLVGLSGGVSADDLGRTLGLDRRPGFKTVGPDVAPFSYGRPIEMIAIPEAWEVPLQAVNEGLTFYAAYRARNYRAMAAVSAMSLWGGTLRWGIDAVVDGGDSGRASIEDLSELTAHEIAILGYLWHTAGKTGSDLYREVGSGGTWKDLADLLKDMERRYLIRTRHLGVETVYLAEATPADARRVAIASGDPDRISAVLQAIVPPEAQERSERDERPAGHSAETQ